MRECARSRAHGLHELSWRLGVLHGERHGVRLPLLVALDKVVWAGALLFLISLLPSGPEVFAGVDSARYRLHPSVCGRFWKNLPVCVACSRCPHME